MVLNCNYQGMVDARLPENLLWNIERIVTNIFIPILNSSSALGGSEDLQIKVKNELLPCLRSFTRSELDLFQIFLSQLIWVFLAPSGWRRLSGWREFS